MPPQGVTNFAVYSSAATAVSLVLFTEADLQVCRRCHPVCCTGTASAGGGGRDSSNIGDDCQLPQAGHPTHEVALDPVLNRTGDTWHIALPQLDGGLLYGGRLHSWSSPSSWLGYMFKRTSCMTRCLTLKRKFSFTTCWTSGRLPAGRAARGNSAGSEQPS
jgi:pullulanase/glycogen debranching enzyme